MNTVYLIHTSFWWTQKYDKLYKIRSKMILVPKECSMLSRFWRSPGRRRRDWCQSMMKVSQHQKQQAVLQGVANCASPASIPSGAWIFPTHDYFFLKKSTLFSYVTLIRNDQFRLWHQIQKIKIRQWLNHFYFWKICLCFCTFGLGCMGNIKVDRYTCEPDSTSAII